MMIRLHFLVVFFVLFRASAFAGVPPVLSAPVLTADENYGPEATVLTGNVGDNDMDPEGDILTFTVLTSPPSGSFVMQPNGAYTYVPLPEYNGFFTLTYQACDPGGNCATSTLELALLFVNDPPVIVNDEFFITQNSTFTGSVATNDYDVDIEPIFYTLNTAPAQGSVSISYTTGNFTYTPPPGFLGDVTWTYFGCDPCGVCNTGTVTIHVLEQNNPPITNDDEGYGPEDEVLTGSVATNDTDPDGNTLTFSMVSTTTRGTLVMQPNGDYTFTPNANYHGLEDLTYRACDVFNACTTGTLSIYISSVNDAPVATPDVFNGLEDQTITGNVGANDFDVDIEPLSFIVNGTSTGGTFTLSSNGNFTFVPLPNWSGVGTARYYAIDPCGFTSALTLVTFNIAAVNDLPIAVGDQFSGNENEVITGDVSLNDSDIETPTAALQFTVATAPTNGVLVMNANGTFSYTPNTNYFGVDAAVYRVTDANGGTTTAQMIFEVISVNSVPVIQDDVFSTNEDEVLNADVSLNDVLEPGETLVYTLGNPPLNGTIVFNANGTFTYTPFANFNGTDSFGYVGTDPFGASDLGVATITVIAVNDPPIVNDDAFSGLEDHTISGTVAANDSDVEPDVLTFAVVTDPSNGTFSLNAGTGTFVYTPFLNFNGLDQVVYAATDEDGATVEATVYFTILPVNDVPIAFPDEFTTNEDVGISGSVSDNDVDFDGDTLNFTLTAGPANGVLQWNPDGSFNYTPNFNFFGDEVMSYVASDDVAGTSPTSFVIHVVSVNDAPVAQNDFVLTLENVAVSGNVSTNDLDIDSPSLTYTVITPPQTGVLVLQTNGAFTFTPALNVFGIQQVTYQVSDGQGGTATAILSIAVQSVNSAPVAVNDDFFMLEDGVLNGSVATNDSDVESPSLNFIVLTSAANGVLNLQSNGSFVYTPAANFNGIDTFRYIASDGEATDTALVTIYVNSVNDLPVLGSDDFTVNEDAVFNGNLASNDTDADGNAMVYTLVNSTTNGALLFNASGTFVYTPNANFHGQDSFLYSWTDGQGANGQLTVYITVASINDAPVAVNDAFAGNEDTPLTGNVSLNDSDVDNAILTYTLLVNTTNGTLVLSADGSFVYTPFPNANGRDVFTYSVTDAGGLSSVGSVDIDIAPVNDAPVAVNDAYVALMNSSVNGSVAANDSDVDQDALTFILLDAVSNGSITFQSDGQFSFVPSLNYFGVQVLSYNVCDGAGACASALLTIEIVENNAAPVASGDVLTVDEDTSGSVNVLSNDVDADGNALVVSIINAPLHGVATIGANGVLNYTPASNYFGTDQLIYRICDPLNECDTALVNITVVSVNDLPVVQSESLVTNEDQVLMANVSTNDSDVETAQLVYTLTTPPAVGTATLSTSGQLVYTPAANFNGSVSIGYSACDGAGACASGTASIQILSVNDAPVVNDQSFTLFAGSSISGDFVGNASDADNDALVFSLTSQPAQGVFIIAPDGSFSFQSNENYVGTVTAQVQACDAQLCDAATITFTINAVNHPPVASAVSIQACKGSVVEIGLDTLVSDIDEPSSALVLTALSGVGGVLYFDDPARRIVFELQSSFVGTTSLSYTVCDSGIPSLCASGSISIEVLPFVSPVIDSVVVSNVACNGQSNGSIYVYSAEPNLHYFWNGAEGSAVYDGLSPQTVQLEVAADGLCRQPWDSLLVVAQPEPITLSHSFWINAGTGVWLVASNEVDVVPSPVGGVAPYTSQWFLRNCDGEMELDTTYLPEANSGFYSCAYLVEDWYLQITDANGCQAIFYPDTVIDIGIAELQNVLSASVYPNPGNGEVKLDVKALIGGDFTVAVFNTAAQCVWQKQGLRKGAAWTDSYNWSHLSPGVYVVRISGSGGTFTCRYIRQ